MYLKYVLIVFFLFSGPGDGFFSSAFQSTLQGNVLYKNVVPAGIWITCIFECTDWLKCLFWNSKVFLNNDLATDEVSLVNGLFDWNESFSGSIDVQV